MEILSLILGGITLSKVINWLNRAKQQAVIMGSQWDGDNLEVWTFNESDFDGSSFGPNMFFNQIEDTWENYFGDSDFLNIMEAYYCILKVKIGNEFKEVFGVNKNNWAQVYKDGRRSDVITEVLSDYPNKPCELRLGFVRDDDVRESVWVRHNEWTKEVITIDSIPSFDKIGK